MSKEKEEETTRIYTIPLSRAWIAPRHHRAVRAINMIKEFAARHMKSAEIKIATELNELIWRRGIRFPPRRVTVEMLKDKDGVVSISLVKPSAPPAVQEAPPVEEARVSLAEAPPLPAPAEEAKPKPEEAPAAALIERAKPRKKPRKRKVEERREEAAAQEIAVQVPRG